MGIREVWADEARDFTRWLEGRPDLLGQALGMDLVHEETEARVGSYSADLVFKVENTEELVVVENMLASTDHDHLGKLITYAAGLDASYAVLISPQFRDEHRSALNWLNSISDDFGFFGVALEAWRIDDSRPAPLLRVEVKPDSWRRTVKAATEDTRSEALYRRFWSDFLPALKEKHPNFGDRTPTKDGWMDFRSGRPRLRYRAYFCRDTEGYRLRVDLHISTGDKSANEAIFDALDDKKRTIEDAVGEALTWARLDDKQESRIALYFPDNIQIGEEQRWPEARDWLVDAMGRMRSGIDPVIADLDLDRI